MTESKEKLKSLLMKVKKESEKASLKLNIQKTKIMASGPIKSWQTDAETMATVTGFTFLSSRITVEGDCRPATAWVQPDHSGVTWFSRDELPPDLLPPDHTA